MLVGKNKIKPPRETNLGVAQAKLTLKKTILTKKDIMAVL